MDYIIDYLTYLEIEKGRSKKTIDNYARYLYKFINFSGVSTPKSITDDVVRQYRLWLNRQELDRKTQNYHLIALRGFLKYLVKRDIFSLIPEKIELAKTNTRDIDLIDEQDLERLLSSPASISGTSSIQHKTRALRDKALLELLFSTGLRVSELCALDKESIPLNRDEFSVRGKGSKIRVVFLSDSAKVAIKKYLDMRADINPALFVSVPRGGNVLTEPSRLTSRSIQRLLKHYALKAGIHKKVTPHMLRHMFATDLLINGADLRSVQVMLGHTNITTTQVYTHLTDKQLRDVHKTFHARRRE